MTMITRNILEKQLPADVQFAMHELRLFQHLRSAGFTKRLGFSCACLFVLVFSLVFRQRNWYQIFDSAKGGDFPGKDAVYRFLNHPCFSWRRFLTLFSAETVGRVSRLTTATKRIKVFIIDDSMYERNRSKKVEMLARFHDHARNCYYKGFRLLTLGWSDGHTFLPLDFALLSSLKSLIHGISNQIDKRTCGYRRRKEAFLPAPTVTIDMIDRALDAGVDASYVLMDSWFTHAPLVNAIRDRGLDVIGMVKAGRQRYETGELRVDLQTLYQQAKPVKSNCKGILRSITTQLVPGIRVKVVFVRRRGTKKDWLALLSTDWSLSEDEIIRIYGMRWDIETFFKCAKSLLCLQKEFQGRSYDLLIAHTTIVFTRYILLAWQHRQSTDPRSLGELFFITCDEVGCIDWTVALRQLLTIVCSALKSVKASLAKVIKSQLDQWLAGLPSYIRALLPIVNCES